MTCKEKPTLQSGEVIKDIDYANNEYAITNFGRVWVYPRPLTGELAKTGKYRKGKWLTPTDNGGGYKIVSMYTNKNRKNYYVHRLVAQAFIPNTKNLCEVNHIDGNKSNNNVKNLEWVTSKQNKNHAKQNGLTRPPRGTRLKRNKSGFTGVSFHKSSNSYRVNIMFENNMFEKRGFSDPLKASYIYDVYSLCLHGETGKTNHLWGNK